MREIRYLPELRASEGEDMVLCGYAALFNTESRDLGGFRETIAPGAFARSLSEKADVKGAFNHDPNLILGRTNSGTLTVKEDERGLYWRCQLDVNNTDHKNIYASVKRGDINECSFAFTVAKGGQVWEQRKGTNGEPYASRTLTDVDLIDVSAVTYPAYPATSVAARSLFPEGEAEIRSMISGVMTPVEKRDDDSYEELICELSRALAKQFPLMFDDGTPAGGGKFYLCQTYVDHVIVCNWVSYAYFSISYTEDEASETYTFGEPVAVEQDWVPVDGDRAAAAVAELRTQAEAHKAPVAPAVRAHSTEHVEGDCADGECACNNRMVDPEDAFGGDEEDDERKALRVAEMRKKAAQVLTKSVDGKNLTDKFFAYVGDPNRTETWKLPIQDANHVKDALARFAQTQGIPAGDKANVLRKIKDAAASFGVTISETDNVRCVAATPMDEDELRAARLRLLATTL